MKKYLSIIFFAIFISIQAQQKLDSIYLNVYQEQFSVLNAPKTVNVLTQKDIQQLPVENIDELLENIAGIDIRSRGSKGVQSDVSIRGGNFDQVLILLNGIPLNNFQTGHHNLDLPVSLEMIKKIEILEGAAGQSFGVNAYSGIINIITHNAKKNNADIGFKSGNFGYIKTYGNLNHQTDKIKVSNGIIYQKSNGYLTKDSINNTDFYTIKDFLNIQIASGNHPIYIQAGYHQKEFGANSFYTSKYPWQFEKTHGYFASISKKLGKKQIFEPYVNYRLHLDEFQLFRESVYQFENGFYIHKQDTAQYAPGIYYPGHNYHKTQEISGGIKTNFQAKNNKIFINFYQEYQKIWSNVLGKPLAEPIESKNGAVYTQSDQRQISTLNLNHQTQINKLNWGTGINLSYSPEFNLQVGGGTYISSQIKNATVYASVNSAVRLPTFTDLYYKGPSNIGNPDLKPERSITYETGYKFYKKNISSNVSIFYRQGENTIDWVKESLSEKWQPQNITRLNTYGIEFSLSKNFDDKFLEKINLSYAYLNMEKQSGDWISKYALDYLKHKFTLNIRHHFLYGITASWQMIYKDRNGQYLNFIDGSYKLFDYQPYFLTHLKLKKKVNKMDFELNIENIFNKEYRDLSYIKMPGRWVILGFCYHFTPGQ